MTKESKYTLGIFMKNMTKNTKCNDVDRNLWSTR